ncbi:ATPase family AAA domain-containing protein 3B [Diplodia seriata]|uniref:ATPase family AAA domain-containing protein 3B n=1 Tax=Diplodia seriata TaxID=420778 RepID=A0A1S8B436_9PEZI|nr:ATPase family AAA domain-containing protein 3B [Diplodia seriata]
MDTARDKNADDNAAVKVESSAEPATPSSSSPPSATAELTAGGGAAEPSPSAKDGGANKKSAAAAAAKGKKGKKSTPTKKKVGAAGAARCRHKDHATSKKRGKHHGKKKYVSDDDEESETADSEDEESDAESTASSTEESSDEDEQLQIKSKKKAGKKGARARKAKSKSKGKRKAGKKHGKKSKKYVSSSEDSSSEESESESDSSDSSSESESESEKESAKRSRRRHRKARRAKQVEESDATATADEGSENGSVQTDLDDLSTQQLNQLLREQQQRRRALAPPDPLELSGSRLQKLSSELKALKELKKKNKESKRKGKKSGKRASTLEYKRVDELWDSKIHNYKLTESAEDPVDEFNSYIFNVRRRFDWENKYRNTVVDIKSKLLKEALQEVMKDVKGVSLVEEQPCIDPNMLFLYLEELRRFAKKTLKSRTRKQKKKKTKRRLKLMASHCKVMISYLDEDYDETKKTLYPMLEAGNITFDLLWALFKPNTMSYTTTYGSVENPRCFKVDYATKESSFIRGDWYSIEGRYLEYDGKTFGLGELELSVDAFKGPRKITSLATYPLRYHKDPDGIKQQLIERGKRFVTMTGMNYRFHKGLAFEKRKKMVLKHNINGRVMIDPAIFRRINANYPISVIKPKDQDDLWDFASCGCSDDESDDEMEGPHNIGEEHEERQKYRFKMVHDEEKKAHLIQVPVDDDGNEIQAEKLDKLAEAGEDGEGAKEDNDASKPKHEFTEEELLIASPVVLGFAFSEKRWMEFSLSGVRDIEWNEGAFESLVLRQDQKSIVKALVSSHKFHAAQTIDDVVQGKGKGLVFVLHGPPGVGKTLTAEGIADYLKSPLYAVSAGELGTDSWRLEQELQKIMDIAHSWGAILLLDEADVFLERRQVHDIHRNALVSIFLRLLEYFQGILFLTTNRVETFDDAFQSRIHMGLRYEELGHQAKRQIWRMFLDRVRDMGEAEMVEFRDDDYNTLARNELNGRQIKNTVRTAQALAVNMGEKLSMEHIKRVLAVAESFERDLRGGSGYEDAMRSYT